jgi:hypothetical protein
MHPVKKAWRIILVVILIVVVVDALAFFTIVFWPESTAGRWLAQYEPLFNYLQSTSLKTKSLPPIPESPYTRKVTYVEGDHYVLIPAGHPIFILPDLDSELLGKTEVELKLKVIEENDGWYLLEFSFGEGWIHPFVTSKFIEKPQKKGEVETTPEPSASSGGKGMQIELRVEPDTGRRPDAIYFDQAQDRQRPILFSELFSEYDPSDLAALPPGADPARLQLATELLGEEAGQKKVGDFIIRFQSQSWADKSARILGNLRNIYRDTFQAILIPDSREHIAYIFLLPSMRSYRSFYEKARSTGVVQTAGHYESGIVAIHPNAADGGNPERTLVHESVHHFNHVLLGIGANHSVIWLDEGLASYFGLSRIDKEGMLEPGNIADNGIRLRMNPYTDSRLILNTGSPKGRIYLLQRELRSGHQIDLQKLLSLNGDSFYSGKIMINYSLSWMLVHYLMHGKEGNYRENFFKYIVRAREGEVTPSQFATIIGKSLNRFENELRAYILSR